MVFPEPATKLRRDQKKCRKQARGTYDFHESTRMNLWIANPWIYCFERTTVLFRCDGLRLQCCSLWMGLEEKANVGDCLAAGSLLSGCLEPERKKWGITNSWLGPYFRRGLESWCRLLVPFRQLPSSCHPILPLCCQCRVWPSTAQQLPSWPLPVSNYPISVVHPRPPYFLSASSNIFLINHHSTVAHGQYNIQGRLTRSS